jgi:hypothetical protein
MSFKTNDHSHGYIHGTVHDNIPIFGTNIHLSMPNNSAKRIFQIFVRKKWVFGEASPNKMVQKETSPTFTQSRYYKTRYLWYVKKGISGAGVACK